MVPSCFALPALFASAFLFAAGWAAAGPLSVKTVTIEESADTYDVSVAYPETGVTAIDEDIAAWAKGAVGDFIKSASEDRLPEERAYELGATFEVKRNDDETFAVVFTEYFDTGGAHPNSDFVTFNYLMPDGWRVYLPEIFDGRKALQKISALAVADLTPRLTEPDGMSDADWIKGGAGPDWDNFLDFVLQPKVLHIDFPSYQVAAYAAGPQETDIPLSALMGLMRTDWRAPAASFDCAAAATATEKAICADVGLARLDRDVATAYQRRLGYEQDAAKKDEIKQAQRAWLGTRDAACPGAAVPCLAEVYKARLAELQKYG